jgi:hypothetical protein
LLIDTEDLNEAVVATVLPHILKKRNLQESGDATDPWEFSPENF